MDTYSALNTTLVKLFNQIMGIERKCLITEEFKDISTNDMHIIECIGLDRPKNMSSIAKQLGVTVGTLTIAVNGLVKKGYVHRRRSEIDRRVVYISLTEQGVAAYRHHEAFHQEMIAGITDHLNEQKRELLAGVLERLNEYFQKKYEQ